MLGVLPGLIGILQATEVVKILLGIGKPLTGRLLSYNALDMSFREIRVRRNPQCRACSPAADLDVLPEYEESCLLGARRPSYSDTAPIVLEITPHEALALLNDPTQRVELIDVRGAGRNPDLRA